MEYQELAILWDTTHSDLESQISTNKKLIKEISVEKVKKGLFNIKAEGITELVANGIFTFFLIGFFINNLSQPKLLIPAGMLLLLMIWSTIFVGKKVKLSYMVDSGKSIVENQSLVHTIIRMERLEINSLWFIIPFFWAPFLAIIAKSFLGIDINIFGKFFVSQFFGSLVIAGILVYFLKKYPDKKLIAANSFLEEIKHLRTENDD